MNLLQLLTSSILSSGAEENLSEIPSSSVLHTTPAEKRIWKPWSNADKELLLSLRSHGMSYEDIS